MIINLYPCTLCEKNECGGCDNIPLNPNGDLSLYKLNGVCDEILKHIKKHRFIVNILAELSGLPRQSLGYYYKKWFNLPPGRIIENVRLEIVIDMIVKGEKIYNAALEAGYKNENHLFMIIQRRFDLKSKVIRRYLNMKEIKEIQVFHIKSHLWSTEFSIN